MSKSKIFKIISLSFLGGIGGASFYFPHLLSNHFLLIFLILDLSILFSFYQKKLVLISSFSFLFFLFGFFWTEKFLRPLSQLESAGKRFSGQVLVKREPEKKENYQRIVVQPVEGNFLPPKSLFLLTDSLYEDYQYGEILKVDCLLEKPENKGTFDYQLYLAKEKIFYLCQKSQITKLNDNRGSKAYVFLLKIKDKINNHIKKIIPAPEAGLLSGLLLGGDDELSQKMKDSFSQTGMTHIVAVSGYNVTIIAEYLILIGIFLGLWRKQAFWLALIGIFLFILMIGFPSSAVRAGIMGGLLLWAIKNGRLANSFNAILTAASGMLLLNPLLFRWDIGFQLSFLATLGIIYFYPLGEKYFSSFLEKFSIQRGRDSLKIIWETLFLSFSAQIFVLPIILYNFGKLSAVSLLANLLILPIIPLTMLGGFLLIVFSFLFFPLAQLSAFFVYWPLRYETEIINFLAQWKYASFQMTFPWWGLIIWYTLMAGWIYYLNKKGSYD